MLHLKTLQQKTLFFLLLPVALLMFAMAITGYMVARNILLAQWREVAVLKLQRAAHQVDMRLSEPKFWMGMFHRTGEGDLARPVQRWIVKQLATLDGVESAKLSLQHEDLGPFTGGEWHRSPPSGRDEVSLHEWRDMMQFHRAQVAGIRPPRYDAGAGLETVSLVSDLLGPSNQKVGQLEVAVRFDFITEDIFHFGWGHGEMALLIDEVGNVLTCGDPQRIQAHCPDGFSFAAVLNALAEGSSGTIRSVGPGFDMVVGYHRLHQAPWALVLMAPSSEILAPIHRFTQISLVTMLMFVLVIVATIRWVVGSTVFSIRAVSLAAQKVAAGDTAVSLIPRSRDEVGQLMESFNRMIGQLEERMRLKESLHLAMEVQQNLLPSGNPQIQGLDIAGISVYCDETGGDYYDFIQFPQWGTSRVAIAVGDVAGHGISAALLMTTARAMLRTRMSASMDLAHAATEVNGLLCRDTLRTGDFMSLLLISLDVARKELCWVRAGHEPAMVYNPLQDSFETLEGEGLALGVLEESSYREYRHEGWIDGKILFMGTDGIWEAQNPDGERFGYERLRTVLREHRHGTSQEIANAVLDAIVEFRLTQEQEDDITMVIVRADGAEPPALQGLEKRGP